MKKQILILGIFCLIATNGFAFDWKKAGYIIQERTMISTGQIMQFKDGDGNLFSVRADKDSEDAQFEKVDELYQRFQKFTMFKIQSIDFTVSSKQIQISLIPVQYMANDINLQPMLPAGLFFVYDNALRYNFRVVRDRLFARVKGLFLNEQEMTSNILAAINDPLAYIQKRDPEYLFDQILMLETQVKTQQEINTKLILGLIQLQNAKLKSNKDLNQATVSIIIDLGLQEPVLTASQIRDQLADTGAKLSQEVIDIVLTYIR